MCYPDASSAIACSLAARLLAGRLQWHRMTASLTLQTRGHRSSAWQRHLHIIVCNAKAAIAIELFSNKARADMCGLLQSQYCTLSNKAWVFCAA